MTTLTVHLTNCGNPDHGQDPDRPLPGTRAGRKKVASLEEAAKVCRAYIEQNDLGGGNWNGGLITAADGSEVGRVSYNGKVWPPGGYVIGAEPLWPPKAAQPDARHPFELDCAEVDVPGYGKVSVTASYRVSYARSVPGSFLVDGRRNDFSANLRVTPDGLEGVHLDTMHPDGRLQASARVPDAMRKAVEDAVRDFIESPEGRGLVLRNEVRDREIEAEVTARRLVSARNDLAAAEDEHVRVRLALMAAREAVDAHESGGPRP